jgi:hypothetical protein
LPAAERRRHERHRQAVAARIELVGEERRGAEARRLDVRRRAGEEHAVDQRQERRQVLGVGHREEERLQAEPADRCGVAIREHGVAAWIRQVEVAMAGGQPDRAACAEPCIGLAIAEPRQAGPPATSSGG